MYSPRSDEAVPWAPTPFSRKMRPWFIVLIILQVILLIVRWRMGDAHGALLMFAVCAVGLLSLSVGSGSVDAVYGGYFGLMAFVSGMLDLNLAIENIVWSEWRQWQHRSNSKGDLSNIAKPAVYLVCATVQLASAFVAYLLYKDAEAAEDELASEPLFATQDQARIYNTVLSHTDRTVRTGARPPEAEGDAMHKHTPFAGVSHKLPP